MSDIAGLCEALAGDCDEGENNYWENGDWKAAAETLRKAAAEITELRTRLHKAVEVFSEAMEENERLKEALWDSVDKATKMQGNEK